MNKKTVITLMLALTAMTAQAQTNKDSIYVYGIVADGFTKAAVPDAFVTLMCQDSTVVDTISVQTATHGYQVFNAPEGSMLDGRIRQLPGVELTDEDKKEYTMDVVLKREYSIIAPSPAIR